MVLQEIAKHNPDSEDIFVRRGCPTDETLHTLEQRVVDVSVADKFDELQKSGHTPVCLFPTRKACNDSNTQMLSYLPSEVHELVCTDEVDDFSDQISSDGMAYVALSRVRSLSGLYLTAFDPKSIMVI